MRFGIIGTGVMANIHAQAIQAMTGARLHSILGRRADVTRELAARYGAVGYTSRDEFLADPELEILTVATATGSHLESVLAAAEAGKHVVVERPLEVSVDRVDRMIEACQKAGVMLSGILNHRFSPAVDALKTAIMEGRFGTLTLAGAFVRSFREQGSYDPSAWRGNWALGGGGVFMNEGIDAIDRLIYLAGDAKTVVASAACLAHANLEVEDTGVAVVEFECGARGVIQCAASCWTSKAQPPEVQLCGESGSVYLVGNRFRLWDFQDHAPMDYDVRATLVLGAEEPEESVALDFAGHQRAFEDVVQAIAEDREPVVSGAEARRAVALIGAIYDSVRNGGQRVEIS
jgi:UDP-N-acetyl-2-amino-2-deoxyglucuronate dehydrogenase